MRTAATVLNIIQERGKRKLPIEDLYRQLYNPELYLRAYAKLCPNKGAMTQGWTAETVDAMALTKINRIAFIGHPADSATFVFSFHL